MQCITANSRHNRSPLILDASWPVTVSLRNQQDGPNKNMTNDDLYSHIVCVIANSFHLVENCLLTNKAITDLYNKTYSNNLPHMKISYERVGHALNKLGFKKTRTGSGASAIFWDKQRTSDLMVLYGIGSKQT